MKDLRDEIQRNVQQALTEDVGEGDLTAALIPSGTTMNASVISREDAVLCGMQWFATCFMTLAPDTVIDWFAKDGDKLQAGQKLCEVTGNARALLTAERSALNFLQLLSAGIMSMPSWAQEPLSLILAKHCRDCAWRKNTP